MANDKPNRIAVLLNDAFADWETGFLSATAHECFGADILHFSPQGHEVVSEGGLRVVPSGGFDDVDPAAITALVVCGSAKWISPTAHDISETLRTAEPSGVVIGVICAATLAAARAGLFDARRHTSNGPTWLIDNVPNYQGSAHYHDANDAIVDRGVVSAPGTAPVAFAKALLSLIYPDHPNLAEARAMLSETR